jgi:hypothetical protein
MMRSSAVAPAAVIPNGVPATVEVSVVGVATVPHGSSASTPSSST